jgi:hypothetical protein
MELNSWVCSGGLLLRNREEPRTVNALKLQYSLHGLVLGQGEICEWSHVSVQSLQHLLGHFPTLLIV